MEHEYAEQSDRLGDIWLVSDTGWPEGELYRRNRLRGIMAKITLWLLREWPLLLF